MSSSDLLTLSSVSSDQVRPPARSRRILVCCGFTVGVLAALVSVLVSVLVGIPVLLALVVGLVLGGVAALVVHRSADPVTLRLCRARPAEDEGAYRRYHNLVEGLCTTAGMAKPRLYVTDDPGANALVCGVNRRQVTLVVTTGLLDDLTRIELEAVLAHLLVKARDQDLPAMTLVVPVVRLLPAGLAGPLVRSVASPTDVTYTDLTAVSVTRYPPGLAEALDSLAREGTAVSVGSRALEHLWLAAPEGHSGAVHPPLADRAALLREL